MFKQWFKSFIALCLCIISILSPMIQIAHAEDYIANDDSEQYGATYYIIEGKDVDDLFDFGISDVDDLASWIFNFKTFTVIKEFQNNSGNTDYKMYFNTPNLQSLLKNRVISNINDGYTDNTYNVNDTQWMVKVGKGTTKKNVITKYGFNIPNYTYMGEYPKEVMSIAGIVPTTWYGKVWVAIKSVFGASFISAPDADNFNTITYQNNSYFDKNEYIMQFFKKYYLPYFDRKVAETLCDNGEEYFTGPEDLIDKTVTKDAYDKAVAYNNAHKEDYLIIDNKKKAWEAFEEGGYGVLIASYPYINEYETSVFLSLIPGHQADFSEWGNQHKNFIYISLVNWCNAHGGSVSDFGITSASDDLPTDEQLLSKIICALNEPDFNDFTYVKIKYKVTTYIDDDNDPDTPAVAQEEWKEEVMTYTEAIDSNHEADIQYITDQTDSAGSCPKSDKDGFESGMSFLTYPFTREDFVSDEEMVVWTTYNNNVITIDKYLLFTELMSHGDDPAEKTSMKEILYRQCMIKNDGEDGECWSTKYGQGKTTITIANVYAYSGLYKITQHYSNSSTQLSDTDVYKILTVIQSYCGPYYSEVLGNMIKLMCATAQADGISNPLNDVAADDPRVMPYDVDTLLTADQKNYSCTDPRVDLYKSHIIGGVVSNLTINYGFEIFIKPQKAIIDICGRLTELSVFMQQLCNFDTLDDYGLSPINMWKDNYVALLLSLLAIYFIVKTVASIIKMGSSSNTKRVIIAFIFFFLELGFLTAIAASPQKVWNTVKNVETTIMNLGELSTVYNNTNLTYLYGDATDLEVTYYMPYLDLWSKYNTGYGILDAKQKINTTRDKAELKDFTDNDYPKIGTNNVKHYSIMLMDAFSYYGDSNSAASGIVENGVLYNGPNINNNAYRVVDHFMAPRVTIDKSSDKIELSVKENENYNGEFQSGFVDLIVKMLNCILMCLISLIKFCTFIWQWFVIYIFIFRVILSKGAEGKTWTDIFIETFSPTLCIMLIGLYAGMVMQMGMDVEGIIGIFLELFLFWLTFMLIRWWKSIRRGQVFPNTLQWIYILTNLTAHRRARHSENLSLEANQNALDAGIDFTEEQLYSFDARTEYFFNEDGTIKNEYNNDKYIKPIEDWYKYCKHYEYNNTLTDSQRRAMQTIESDDRFKHIVQSYKNDTAKNTKNKSRQNNYAKNNNSNSSSSNNTTTPTTTENQPKKGDEE